MGNDAPHAVLSQKPSTLFNYFKQLSPRSPTRDRSIREDIVMSLESYIGSRKTCSKKRRARKRLKVVHPILTNDDMARIKALKEDALRSKHFPRFSAFRKRRFHEGPRQDVR